jgi:exopolysaccharide production protein ExoQ
MIQPRSSTPVMNAYLLAPIAACGYALIIHPLILTTCSPLDSECLGESRLDNKIFWSLLAGISWILAIRYYSRIALPQHIAFLFALLGIAGLSIAWAFRPDLSLIRFALQCMIVSSIVLPILTAGRHIDVMRGLFLCFAFAMILNLSFVYEPKLLAQGATPGLTGYFSGKNYLGLCSAIALLLAAYEACHSGLRRVFGLLIMGIALWLLILSNARTALGLALVAPALAGLAVLGHKASRLSPTAIPLAIIATYLVVSSLTGIDVYKLSYYLYGDSTFSGRKFIWQFAQLKIAERPLLGWGYQSFWLAGPNAPSVTAATGWIKTMPNSHSGYLDTILEMGYVGFALLVLFVLATVHASRSILDRSLARGWIILSIAYFIIMTNGFESMWMRSYEIVWVVFVLLAAEIAGAKRSPAYSGIVATSLQSTYNKPKKSRRYQAPDQSFAADEAPRPGRGAPA